MQQDAGLINTTDLLLVEQNLLSAEMNLVQTRQAELEAIVSLALAVGGGFASEPLHKLFETDSSFWQVSGAGILNIFQGGKIIAQNKMASAKYREMLATYQNTVQLAFKDAYDSLNANKQYRKMFDEIK